MNLYYINNKRYLKLESVESVKCIKVGLYFFKETLQLFFVSYGSVIHECSAV